jgi:hypothetical protein
VAQRIHTAFDGRQGSQDLSSQCLDLISEQKESWSKLKDAYEILKTLKTRALLVNGFSVLLYHNPGRLTSATTAVGQKDIKDRPCFLCLHNLPHQQKGILYRKEYIILCNPMPVFPSHLTVAHVTHQPQAISDNFDAFLALMADLGEGWVTLYNGPRCGASAPDHLHFQALPVGRLPIEQELRQGTKLSLAAQIGSVSIYTANEIGREVIVLKGDDRASMVNVFAEVLACLREVAPTGDEPMMNAAGFYETGSWHVALFPRRKHRPDAFFREGDERIVVSPGAVEMAGILVTPLERDFEGLDATAVEAIYREVSLDGSILAEVLGAIR